MKGRANCEHLYGNGLTMIFADVLVGGDKENVSAPDSRPEGLIGSFPSMLHSAKAGSSAKAPGHQQACCGVIAISDESDLGYRSGLLFYKQKKAALSLTKRWKCTRLIFSGFHISIGTSSSK